MPVFNEARTFKETFDRVASAEVAGVRREIIIVESNSTDGSRELVQAVEGMPGITVLYEAKPEGKGMRSARASQRRPATSSSSRTQTANTTSPTTTSCSSRCSS